MRRRRHRHRPAEGPSIEGWPWPKEASVGMRSVLVVLVIVALASAPAASAGTNGDVDGREEPSVRTPAEWETTETVLVRWGWETTDYHTELIHALAPVTDVDVVVSDRDQRTAVRRHLLERDVDLGNVSFVVAATDTIWIRDYGPLTVLDRRTGDRAFVDSLYSVFRTADDAFPGRYAAAAGADLVRTGTADADVWLDGGGIMVDGAGSAFVTGAVFRRNDPRLGGAVPRDALQDRLADVLGLRAVRNVSAPVLGGTQHVDMQAKLLDETTVLVADVPRDDPDYEALESTAAYFRTHRARNGMPYTVVRVPMPKGRSGPATIYYSYTNSLIVNGKVLVPTYGLPTDDEALAVYRDGMPGYEVVGVDAAAVAGWDGAIHCTALGIPSPNPAPQVRRLDATTEADGTVLVSAAVADDGRLEDVSVYYSTSGHRQIQRAAMTPTADGTFETRFSGLPNGTVVRYFVTARDDDGAVTYAGDRRRMRSVEAVASTAAVP